MILKLGEGRPARIRERDPKPEIPKIKKPAPEPTEPKGGKKPGSIIW